MAQKKLDFFDLSLKRKFKTNKYTLRTINGRKQAVTTDSPSGNKITRFVAKNFNPK